MASKNRTTHTAAEEAVGRQQ